MHACLFITITDNKPPVGGDALRRYAGDSLTIAAKQSVQGSEQYGTENSRLDVFPNQGTAAVPRKSPLALQNPEERPGTSGLSLLLCAMVEIALCTMLCGFVRSIVHVVVSGVSCLWVKGMT